jgi:hypothetical protein
MLATTAPAAQKTRLSQQQEERPLNATFDPGDPAQLKRMSHSGTKVGFGLRCMRGQCYFRTDGDRSVGQYIEALVVKDPC